MTDIRSDFKKLCLTFCAVYLSFLPVLADEFTPSAVLSSWNRYLDTLKVVEFSSSFTDYYQSSPNDYNTFSLAWKVDFGSQRYWNGKNEEIREGFKSLYESSFVSHRSISVSLHSEKGKCDEYTVVSYVKIPDTYWNDSLGLLYMAYPFGYINDKDKILYLPDIMTKGSLNLIKNAESIDLQCLTPHFDIMLRLLPEKNFATQQIEIKRLTQSDNPFVFQECKYTVKKFLEVDGRWFPVEYNVEEKYESGKRESPKPPKGMEFSVPSDLLSARTIVAVVNLTNVKFPKFFSDKDFEIATKIPNGTPVSMQDAPQIKYVWENGEIVPYTDEVALRIAQGNRKFMPGPNEPRFWIMFLGFGLFIVGGGLKLYFHFYPREKDL